MNKTVRNATLAVIAIVLLGSVVRSRCVLDSRRLEAAVKEELPPGTPKTKVIQFIQAKRPLFWDDEGTHIRAKMTGRAENLIYRRDIVLDFEFDLNEKLLSYTKHEYLTFL